jgi:hypothetical protein
MANTIEATGSVLKTDGLGRIRTPPERKAKLLDEFERSGLSGFKFAALVGVKYQTFAGWVAQRKKEAATTKPAVKPVEQVRWLEAVVAEAQQPVPSSVPSLKLRFPGGAWLEINTAQQAELAVVLVRALEKRSC